jgi:hypothetical protein
MARFWSRGDECSALEARLRGDRPRPGAELERRIGDQVGRRPRTAGRAVLAVVLTAGVFGAMASFGGVGYAVSSVKNAVNPVNALTPSGDQYGTGSCTEYVNPHGKTIPPAGLTPPGTNPKGGENPDGFYQVGSTGGGEVYVVDLGSTPNTVFGPYPGGTVIKYTQAPGGTPGSKSIGSTTGQAGAVYVHITGKGDFEIAPVGGGPTQTCLVPPPPK